MNKFYLRDIYWAYSKDGKIVVPLIYNKDKTKILNLETNEIYNISYFRQLEPIMQDSHILSMVFNNNVDVKTTPEMFKSLQKLPVLKFLSALILTYTDNSFYGKDYGEIIDDLISNDKIYQNKIPKLKRFFKKELAKNNSKNACEINY